MHVALIQLPDGGIVAVKFATRERADRWAYLHNSQVVGFAPAMSLDRAAGLAHDLRHLANQQVGGE